MAPSVARRREARGSVAPILAIEEVGLKRRISVNSGERYLSTYLRIVRRGRDACAFMQHTYACEPF